MARKKNQFLGIIIIFFVLTPQWKVWGEKLSQISLQKVLQLAKRNSRFLSESQLKEVAAEKSINIAKANYFPTINAEAIDSKGFPGSSGIIGVAGLMGSPYRSGWGAGVVVQQTVFDFGRTVHDVETAKYEALYSRENTKVTEYEVKQIALQTFYECASFKTQRNIWADLANESKGITNEVAHFVKTGQRSIVDGYLSEAQTKQALTMQAFFAARLGESIRELGIIIGVSPNSFSCPSLATQMRKPVNSGIEINSSPLLARAIMGAKVATEELKREKAGYYPKIVAAGSIGGMESTRLVSNENYAIGVGVAMPIFDMHLQGEIQRAQALASAQMENVEAEKQYLAEMNGKYDEVIVSSKVKLEYLEQELALAYKAFTTAKKRYFSLQGDLVDLREAFNNMARAQVEINNTRTQLLQASGAKALLNGGG